MEQVLHFPPAGQSTAAAVWSQEADQAFYLLKLKQLEGMNTARWYGIEDASLGLAHVERLPLCWSCNYRYAWTGY
ncbi:hypothetical protein Nepgr_016489 [Nepenthes gracilis]|uniref:Uncharacterized protein n=1 Tax=Nepenthes gracilis TaxID=150966 RepID=A0AAD3SNN7_NEPGR|nr:hypothetical protein Nepgr_016489 [Nepenthes gracilis]